MVLVELAVTVTDLAESQSTSSPLASKNLGLTYVEMRLGPLLPKVTFSVQVAPRVKPVLVVTELTQMVTSRYRAARPM